MFWENNKCRNCGTKTKSNWEYCPHCGTDLKEDKRDDIFKDVGKDFRQIEKAFDIKVPRFMIKSPLKSKGISITITSDGSASPRIEVKTPKGFKHEHKAVKEVKPLRIPKSTEEPETKIEKTRDKQVITLNLPNVKSLDDIEIKRLPQSIEVKAFTGDKAYFKLIPVPSNVSINEEFRDGILRLEVVK